MGPEDRCAVVADFPDDVDCAAAVTGSGFIRRNESKHERGRELRPSSRESLRVTSRRTSPLA